MPADNQIKPIRQFIDKMPSLSTTVTKVLEICNNPASSPNDLNRVISLDPVLTGQVLKLINSAYYSIPNRITSLTRAIIMLGLNTVKNLVLATSVLASFKGIKALQSLSIDQFWAHCLCVGVTAKLIAKARKISTMEQEEFFVAGLLHDLGKLPMMAVYTDHYEKAIERAAEEKRSLFQLEKELIGYDHCQIGHLIADKWKLDADMQNAIAHHHQPFEANFDESVIVTSASLANQLAHCFHIGDAGNHHSDNQLLDDLSMRVGTTSDKLIALRPMIAKEVEKAKAFLMIAGKG